MDLSNDIEQMEREESIELTYQLNVLEEEEGTNQPVQNSLSGVSTYGINEEESDSSEEEIETPLASSIHRSNEVDQTVRFAQHNTAPLQRGFNSLCSGYYSYKFQP